MIDAYKQQGATLISLLISISLGVFLVGGMLKIYLDSTITYATRAVFSEVSDKQRSSIDAMRYILVMAGRGIRGAESEITNYLPIPAVSNGTVDGGASGSDTIAVRFRTGPSCDGYQNVGLNVRPSMVQFYVDNNKNLVCRLTTYPSGSAVQTTQIVASNIELLKVLYGLDTDSDNYANRYIPAVTVPSGQWNRVVSMRIGLMLRSRDKLVGPAKKQTAGQLNVLGLTVTEPDTDYLYKLASTTLSLRNMNSIIERE